MLADPSRRAIFEALARRPSAVGELAAQLPISRPAVSQHLAVLKAAGVVADDAVGTRNVYRLQPAAVAAFRDQLDTFWRRTLGAFEASLATDTSVSEPSDDPSGEDT
ncbi:metalloregulator ArsR/SmtB family transcription factor [Jatrophihabitans fulvus]